MIRTRLLVYGFSALKFVSIFSNAHRNPVNNNKAGNNNDGNNNNARNNYNDINNNA